MEISMRKRENAELILFEFMSCYPAIIVVAIVSGKWFDLILVVILGIIHLKQNEHF